MHKHVTCALMTFWKFLSRKIIELHLNLHTTVSINTVNLFIHCTISIVYIIIMTEFQNLGGGGGGGGGDIPGPPSLYETLPTGYGDWGKNEAKATQQFQ